MGYPGIPGQGSMTDPTIFRMPRLIDVVGNTGARKDTETYEECQARQDPNVNYFVDPCRGKPSGGFKLPDFPRSERPSSPVGMPPFGMPEQGSVQVPSAGFPMAGFPSYRLEDKMRRGDFKGAAGVLVGGVLGSVLGDIIAGRVPFGEKGKQDEERAELSVEPSKETLEQNQEVMGPKAQVFPRFADPGDGTLSTTPMMMATDPSFVVPREKSPQEIREINRRVIPGYDRVRERIQSALRGMA